MDSIIHSNWIYDAYDMGIVVSSAGEGVDLTDDDPDLGTIPFITKNSRRVHVVNNHIRCLTTMDATSAGIYMTLGADACKINGNYIEVPSATTAGIHVPSSMVSYNTPWDYDFRNCEICDNTIVGSDSGIVVTGYGNGLKIHGNTVIDFATNGIYLAAAGSQVMSGVEVDYNHIIPGAGAAGTRYGIRTANTALGSTYAVIGGRNKFNIADIGDTFRPMLAANDSTADSNFMGINVADFGAIGDNSTDDSVAINYAVYAVNNAPIGELHFPDKTYVTTAGLDAITNTNCKVTGHPPAALTGGFPRPEVGGTTSAADELAIPVTHSYVAKTTGGDAEALTLADGQPGQVLVICLVTDGGGDGTLTPTTKSGFATIVFADVGDTAALLFTNATTGWVILGTAGVAAPPVITT